MKLDCVHIDDNTCYLPARLCNDDCERYKTETHPFACAENKGCAEYQFKKDMGDFDNED